MNSKKHREKEATIKELENRKSAEMEPLNTESPQLLVSAFESLKITWKFIFYIENVIILSSFLKLG